MSKKMNKLDAISNEVEPVEKKKKGRKPKIATPEKEPEKEIPEDTPVIKKRGRKPKNKDIPEEKVNQVDEKIVVKKIDFTEEEETLILFIPINLKKFENQKTIENEPVPYMKNDDYSDYSAPDNITNLKDKYTNQSVDYLLQQFKETNKQNTYPNTTNIYCWWCCHPFKDTPVQIPFRYKKDKFEGSGCFCSYNCASAYNISNLGKVSNEIICERNSLLHLMYKKLNKVKHVEIKPAPPKEILQIFGGIISIDEYRKNNVTNEFIFKINVPPLMSIIPQVEITTSFKSNTSYLPINEKRIKVAQSNNKAKITQYLSETKNTVDKYMNIKKSNEIDFDADEFNDD